MVQDEVLFTPQLATVVVDLHRRIGRAIDAACGASYLEFCLLASVRSHNGSMTLAEFPRKVLANDNTVVVAANSLARVGMVGKRRCSDDGRIAVLEETACGTQALKQGFDGVCRSLRASVWANHADEDIDEIMHSFPTVAEKLGVDSVEINHRCHPVVTPAYLMITAAILRSWTQTVSRFAGLSFAEYRCLAVLETRPTPLSCATIAETLMLDRSSVSALVAKLDREGLVWCDSGPDRRRKVVGLTEKGEVSAALVTAKLGRLTADLYSGVEPSLKSKTNELHMRMHAAYTHL